MLLRALPLVAVSLMFAVAQSVVAEDLAAPVAEPAAPKEIVFVFQKQKDPAKVKAQSEEVAAFLSQEVGVPVRAIVPSSYGASVQALVSNQAQVAYVSSLPFLLAQQEAPVQLILAEVRDDRTDYDSIIVVRADDQTKTLAELKGKRMLFTSPTSTSGYLMPYSRLVQEGLLEPKQDPATFFSAVNFGGSYDKALLGVLNGQADVCAVSDYTLQGPKADIYLSAEQRAGLRVLAEIPGVPTHGICLRTDLPADLQAKLKAGILKLSAEKPELLGDVYGASTFKAVDGTEHVKIVREALENTGLGLKGFVQ
jgi:phosphonate transport system substrate-binding protein